MCNMFVRKDTRVGEEDMMVRVYKDVYVGLYENHKDDYKQIALDVALDCLSDFDVEILEEDDDDE